MSDISYIFNYVPTTASHASSREIAERNTILDFLDGDLSSSIKESVIDKIRKMSEDMGNVCIITFMPSWTQERTMERYGKLASFLSSNLDIEVFPDALTLKQDSDPVVLKKEYSCDASRIKGKTVILVGGVINTGHSFERASQLLIRNGAKCVKGLFVAKVKDTE